MHYGQRKMKSSWKFVLQAHFVFFYSFELSILMESLRSQGFDLMTLRDPGSFFYLQKCAKMRKDLVKMKASRRKIRRRHKIEINEAKVVVLRTNIKQWSSSSNHFHTFYFFFSFKLKESVKNARINWTRGDLRKENDETARRIEIKSRTVYGSKMSVFCFGSENVMFYENIPDFVKTRFINGFLVCLFRALFQFQENQTRLTSTI